MQKIDPTDTISCRSVLAGKYVRNLTCRSASGEPPIYHRSIVGGILADGRQKALPGDKMKNAIVEMVHSADELSKTNFSD